MPLRVLVNAWPMTGVVTGVSRYLRNLYGTLGTDPFSQFVRLAYFDGQRVRHTMPSPTGTASWIKSRSAVWKLPAPVVFALRSAHWLTFEISLRRHFRNAFYDIYHETAFVPAAQRAAPTVFTVYDLSLLRYPETHPKERVWFFEFFRNRRFHYSNHIVTLSRFVKNEVCDFLHWPEERVTAIPLAPAPHFKPKSSEDVQRVLKRFAIPSDYILFVGSLEPRKNLQAVIQALSKTTSKIALVLAGWAAWGEKRWLHEAERKGLLKRIFLTGYVDDETLACLYSGALALVYPSLYEGFGLPILEAMACGCPVICSNASSMPEVAGDAACYISPHNPEELSHAIDLVLQSSNHRNDLIFKGSRRAALFTWQKTAQATMQLFRDVVNDGPISIVS